jgi:hypothetical protein
LLEGSAAVLAVVLTELLVVGLRLHVLEDRGHVVAAVVAALVVAMQAVFCGKGS